MIKNKEILIGQAERMAGMTMLGAMIRKILGKIKREIAIE